jgi:hypothetical protein
MGEEIKGAKMSEPAPIVGYCTNVHAGVNVDAILSNLRTHAYSVRQSLALRSLPVGLWFSESAVREAIEPTNLERIRHDLEEMGLIPYTFNGFPQGDFHSAVVKHRVYLPTWWEPSRLQYTRDLVRLLDQLLEPGRFGSISTLPIAWGSPQPTQDQWRAAADQLLALAEDLHRLYESTGRRIVLALEPEPGCAITDTPSLRRFFVDYLSERTLGASGADRARIYITMCHDVCHAAVMAEDQQAELTACRSEGIRIGKVQVSSAIRVAWDTLDSAGRVAALQELGQFAEDRYLHQTLVRYSDGTTQLVEDLPGLLADISGPADNRMLNEWRIHFHVPIDIASWGRIESTQNEIDRFLDLMMEQKDFGSPEMHLEVETYAWGVLPESLREPYLHQGIARELQWLRGRLKAKVQPPGVQQHA